MLNTFIESHKILEVGIAPDGYLCADLIVNDVAGLINQIAESDFYVSQINWWESALIATGSKLGMGGPPDPRDPEKKFFSEVVHIGKRFDAESSVQDYFSYIESVKSGYPNVMLHPSFDIARRHIR